MEERMSRFMCYRVVGAHTVRPPCHSERTLSEVEGGVEESASPVARKAFSLRRRWPEGPDEVPASPDSRPS